MQVILLEDVKGSGKKHQVINVSDGYAKNFLIPKGLAMVANNSNLTINKGVLSAQQHKIDTDIKEANALKEKINNQLITIKMKVSDNGKTFGAVTSQEIAKELAKLGIEVDKRKLEAEPIKQLGTYSVKAKLYANITANFKVIVIKE